MIPFYIGQLTTEEVLEYSVLNSTSFIARWLQLQFPFCISNCNSTTVQYQIRYSPVGADEVSIVQTTRREFIATGLSPLTNYSLEVTAVNNGNQAGRYTDPEYLFTPAQRETIPVQFSIVNFISYMILGVGIIHHGELIPNNSYVLFSEINETLGALLCVTDKVNCCRGDGSDSLSPGTAQWYYPSGTLVSGTMGMVYQERSTAMVRLLRGDGLTPFGLYHCVIQDKSNVEHSLYVGIYSASEGTHVIIKLSF